MTRLNWGMIGGGEGSQIGPAHRLGAQADGNFVLAAGALDVDAQAGKAYAERLGVAVDRAYGDWQEMLAGEKKREDRIDLVTVATPPSPLPLPKPPLLALVSRPRTMEPSVELPQMMAVASSMVMEALASGSELPHHSSLLQGPAAFHPSS